MLGFVLRSLEMDDNYGQHPRDSPVSIGSPLCETRFTNICSIIRKRYVTTKLLCFTFPSHYNYLCTTMKGTCSNARNRKIPGEIIANAYLDVFSVFVGGHDLHNKMGDVCRNGLLSDMLDERAKLHWQPLFTLQRLGINKTQLYAQQ